MPPSDLVIRPPACDEEREAFFRLAVAVFIDDPPPRAAADLRRFVTGAPGADPSHMRAAYRGETYVGGYLIDERWLQIGSARLRTGCIGAVVTHPDYRRQGVGTALMEDAIAYAGARGHALLLLHGKPDFYTRFGYVDVFDATVHVINCGEILACGSGPYRARATTSDDVPALLELYNRHFGDRPGGFERTVEQQAFQMRFARTVVQTGYRQRDGLPFSPPIVAIDGDDRLRGYLATPWGPSWVFGSEVAADDWPATLALLHNRARSLSELATPPAEVRWPLPPHGLAAQFLADQFTVRCERVHQPRAGWMARPVDLRRLIASLTPMWVDRLQDSRSVGVMGLALVVDGTCVAEIAASGSRHVDSETRKLPTVRLTSAVLMPLLFGYRTIAWAACQPGQDIPTEASPALEIMFPPAQPFVPPTDGC